MTADRPQDVREEMIDLLVDRATEGLEPAKQSRLQGLFSQRADLGRELDAESFELAAAAIELAYDSLDEPMPGLLRDRLIRQASDYYRRDRATRSADRARVLSFPDRSSTEPARSSGLVRWSGWVAAAACLALAVAGWWPRPPESRDPTAGLSTPPAAPIVERVDPAAARAELVAQAAASGDLIELAWSATDDPAAQTASGDVVWSTAAQAGFMRFRGLPVNDPTAEQYQLWIFDAEQDERYPIDGGVFDVAESGEVIVPISAKLEVRQPTLFAITVEKPGGVVVSSRERLPLLAKVS